MIILITIIVLVCLFVYYKSKSNINNNAIHKSNKSKTKSLNTRKLNIISNRKYDKNINNYYEHIVKYMTSSTLPEKEDLRVMNKQEEIFLKEFLYQVQFVRKKYAISIIRFSLGGLMVKYNLCPVGRINLKDEKNIRMQILIGMYGHKELEHLTFDEALQNIRYWISYIKNHLKNTNTLL